MTTKTTILAIIGVAAGAVATVFVRGAFKEGRDEIIRNAESNAISTRTAEENALFTRKEELFDIVQKNKNEETAEFLSRLAKYETSIGSKEKLDDISNTYNARMSDIKKDYDDEYKKIMDDCNAKISEWKKVNDYDLKVKAEDKAIEISNNSYKAAKDVVNISFADEELSKKLLDKAKALRDEQVEIHKNAKAELEKKLSSYENEMKVERNKDILELDKRIDKLKSEATEKRDADRLLILSKIDAHKDKLHDEIIKERSDEVNETIEEYNTLCERIKTIENRESVQIKVDTTNITWPDIWIAYFNKHNIGKIPAGVILVTPLVPVAYGVSKYVDKVIYILKRIN